MATENTLNIVQLIEKNPLTRLTKDYNNKFIKKIKKNFTESQQQLFVSSFYCYLNYDAKNDFVIDLDDIWKWLGFSRKDHCKRVIEKHFAEEIDYKVMLPNSGERKNEGGFNKETILLNVETFKGLCMLAGTERSKEIRKYYIKLETILQELINDETSELRKQLTQQNQKTEILEIALQVEKNNNARLLNRGAVQNFPKKCVYICQGVQGFKVGKTINARRREDELKTGWALNKMVYAKKCYDRHLLEKLTHHILKNYRILGHHEWFDSSEEITKCALDCAQLFADGLYLKGQIIYETGFYDKLKALIDSLPSDGNVNLEQQNNNDDESEDGSDTTSESDSSKEEEESVKEQLMENVDETTNNPLDFNKFIEDCCIINEKSTAFSVDIFGAHRLWSRCSQKQTHDALYKYLCDNYKKVKVFDPVSNARLSSYRGFSLKPIPTFVKNDPPIDIDEFIESKCKIAYNARLPLKEMYNAFESWKKEQDPEYEMNAIERKRVDLYFGNKFLCSHIYNGKCNVHGFFGVSLKDDNNFVGLKLAHKLKKKVVKVDIMTKKIVETYESVTAAAKVIGKSPSYISQDIRFQKPQGQYIYQFA